MTRNIDATPAPARTSAPPAVGEQWVSTLRLAPNHPAVRAERDLALLHGRIIDATAGMPDGPLRVLYGIPTLDLLVIRAPEPVTKARLPAGYATAITARAWRPPTSPGVWRMVGVLNPARHTHLGGPTLNQPDRRKVDGRPKLYSDPVEQAAWLTRRLCAGGPGAIGDPDAARVLDFRVTRAWVARGQHRTGRTITVRCVSVAAEVEVRQPDVVAASVAGGVGIDKTWGCGLTVWAPAGPGR